MSCVLQVELEGWVRLWEDSQGIPSADIPWLKEDSEKGLFTPVQTYKDIKGVIRRRRVLKSDRMWFYPPEPPGFVSGGIPTPQAFFRGRFFFWRPIGVWRCSFRLVHLVIQELKGPAGLDESGVSLFKSPGKGV